MFSIDPSDDDAFDEIDKMLEEQEQKHMPTKPSDPAYGDYTDYPRHHKPPEGKYSRMKRRETEYGIHPHEEYDS